MQISYKSIIPYIVERKQQQNSTVNFLLKDLVALELKTFHPISIETAQATAALTGLKYEN